MRKWEGKAEIAFDAIDSMLLVISKPYAFVWYPGRVLQFQVTQNWLCQDDRLFVWKISRSITSYSLVLCGMFGHLVQFQSTKSRLSYEHPNIRIDSDRLAIVVYTSVRSNHITPPSQRAQQTTHFFLLLWGALLSKPQVRKIRLLKWEMCLLYVKNVPRLWRKFF